MPRRFRKQRSRGQGRAFSGSDRRRLRKQLEQGGLEDTEEFLEPAVEKRPGREAQASDGTPREAPSTIDSSDLREGQVVGLASGLCWVRDEQGVELECVLPSRLAADQQSKLAIGDRVQVLGKGEGRDLRVHSVLPRRTELVRPDPRNARRQRVIAANVDLVVHVAAAEQPSFRPALADRYLIAIERGGARACLCINKIDLLPDNTARAELESQLQPYRELDIDLLCCSARSGEGIDELRRLLAGRTTVFVGHSGVGKSSLLNALAPDVLQATGTLGRLSSKGRHTTTRSGLFRLPGDIRLIDTPGIRELGLWKIDRRELPDYFPDFTRAASNCRFANCTHSHEPECGVRTAAEQGELSLARYHTYLRVLASLD